MMYKVAAALSVLAGFAAGEFYTANPEMLKTMFEAYKTEFGKVYSTMEEESHRFNVFVDNLRIIDDRNLLERQAGGSAQHGFNKFTDMTQAEFEAKFLKSDPAMKSSDRVYGDVAPYEGADSSKDWTGVYTTPVKNQGQCGSCWAFSAAEQIESDAMRTLKVSYTLSPEQIVECDKTSYACDGGWTEHAYNYVKSAGGLATEAKYPYTSATGKSGTCKANSKDFVVKVNGYTTIKGESNMASYVLGTGPLSVCLDASNFNSYTGGIMSKCGNRVNHCVQAVGVDTGSNGYWKVRNSWGPTWGESGYIRLAYGQDTCHITSDPTWASVSKV